MQQKCRIFQRYMLMPLFCFSIYWFIYVCIFVMFLMHVFVLCTPETLANRNVKKHFYLNFSHQHFFFTFCFPLTLCLRYFHLAFFFKYTYNIHIYLYRSHLSLVTRNVCVGFVESDRVRVRAKKTWPNRSRHNIFWSARACWFCFISCCFSSLAPLTWVSACSPVM